MSILIKEDILFIKRLIDKYTQLYVKSDFLNENISSSINLNEIKRGLSIANILSYSKTDNDRRLAFKFSTIITTIIEDDKIIFRCNNILSRLSIFTFPKVLSEKKGYDISKVSVRGVSEFENLYREEYFSRYIANEKVKLNKFQLIVSDAINEFDNISVSAPTSVGKSFLMKKIIVDTILKKEKSKVIYVVPTRALINEVMNDIQKEINRLRIEEKIFITCSSEIGNEFENNKYILILTQERLNQLYCNISSKFNVDLVVIDEAQQISNGARGLLLEYTIRRVKQVWPKSKLFFISPLIKNSEIFIKKFKLENSYYKNEMLSTVNQNVIHIYKPYRESFLSIVYNKNEIGKISFKSSKIKTIPQRIAYIFNKFNNGQNSIIYCNQQSSARNIANAILKCEIFEKNYNNDLKEFSDFLKNYICENYDLANLITYGIAYHYSKMPSIIKIGIEDLAKNGKLKLVTCTTTLLEGVNIQANNIYIYNPKKFNYALSKLEFWNLAGRAGRMSNDICGNIICIDLDKKSCFEEYWDRNIENINFKKNEILIKDVNRFENYLNNKEISENINKKEKEKLVDSYKNLESILILEKMDNVNIVNEYNESQKIIEVDNILAKKIENNKIPKSLLKRLVGIEIERINKIWLEFLENINRIEDFNLLNPFCEGSDKRLDKVLDIINRIFCDNKYSKSRLYAIRITSLKWMREDSMKNILFYDFDINNNKSEEINKKIEDSLELLNNGIRYEFSKYIYAYQEILKEFLIFNKKEAIVEKMCNYPLYLEFGASSKKVLELMYLGIFREGAIVLSKYIKSDQKENIYIELKNLNLDKININKYVKNKIKEKISIL
ncbi:DEAD/DEAH box helicase [Clostridium perfringens]|uniref:DEAD/DEAH box helicase n=2 Tax=Clostridium perfringens TaxID=1502 RepID=UPI00244ABC9F|nr:DEAD/DEAH box helicase [Clostridium perfringens]MDH2338012.1 DEAD/DEAH box helicase [Clostridium perfringens]MDN4736797.1 DEAD/DEAH box helicase [Clostridium perfringens]MDN4740500.1 DEAD/DEAH box helicase [Clostridium perfringens]HDI3015462.1 DEAD/DEAH box helicase [Clostridium perfringens]